MMVQRRSRGRGRSSHRHRRSIFKFLLLVLIGFIFIYFTPTTDYFLTTKTIGRVSKAKIRTINTNVTNPIEIKTVKTRNNKNTSTPPFQKQYIIQINYHKTGHAISYQYRTILRKLLQQERKQNKVTGKGKNIKRSKIEYGNDDDDDDSNFDYQLLSTLMTANNSIHTLKRTHSNETTGCPTKQQFWNTLLLNNETTTTETIDTDSDTILIKYANAGSLDLFCNIDENDLFNLTTHKKYDGDDNSDGSSDNSQEQPPQNYQHHDIKIIHLIRNPIDMVVSAYLYHSQRPTPEVWVKKKHGVFYNPCNLNYDIIHFYDRLKSSTEEDYSLEQQQFDTIISQKEGQQIEGLCQTLMYNNDTKQPYRHLYDALTKLSSIHGVQLMTIQLLVSNFHSGSDLLRMVLNIIRLNQWSDNRNNRKHKNNNKKILTLEMGNDWSFNYTDTVTRTTQFIVEDLEDLLVLQQQQQQHKSNSSTNNSEQLIKSMTNSTQKFITTVTSLMKEQKQKVKIRNDQHFTSTNTKKWSSKDEKDTIIEQLLSDELLGPILFKLQQVTNTAIGLTKHQ
ncbi:hypothetical protein FRACYDRAFT_252632 [Fragilariopsis cylindrus CCMP1102]|uniref:Sulfotransferase domain-containing protein n=1 Tax=Fragilariopsis cylindrus CCMP1102 TaxID=635003 RepID=A0A1E7EM41_9STRA|nr:hypothetical protein FRACYDRAFT_252632 [Fragilariopsis cylindrus CCMP1102]|eukprot:OEU06999.1 hypothetical protein FRACYDRAFT_252632 [Fragilariopsis cylindrus CCMP1102]